MARNENPEATETTPAAAAAPTKPKKQQVNATIDGDLFKWLDDYRWEARIDGMPKLVTRALEEFKANHSK